MKFPVSQTMSILITTVTMLSFLRLWVSRVLLNTNFVAAIEQTLKADRLLNAHYKYYVREMRIAVYNQLLQSYRSLTIESMAKSFGVSEDWIDRYRALFLNSP